MTIPEPNEPTAEQGAGQVTLEEKAPVAKPTSWPDRILYKIENVVSFYLIGGIALFIMLWIAAEIFGRLAFNHTFYGVVDVVEIAVLVLVFASLGGVQRENSHMTMDLLEQSLKGKRAGQILRLIVRLLTLVVALIFTHQGIMAFLRSYQANIQTLALFWPIWPAMIFIPLGFLMLTIRLSIQFQQDIASLLKPKG